MSSSKYVLTLADVGEQFEVQFSPAGDLMNRDGVDFLWKTISDNSWKGIRLTITEAESLGNALVIAASRGGLTQP